MGGLDVVVLPPGIASLSTEDLDVGYFHNVFGHFVPFSCIEPDIYQMLLHSILASVVEVRYLSAMHLSNSSRLSVWGKNLSLTMAEREESGNYMYALRFDEEMD